jgi:hypothetical protein
MSHEVPADFWFILGGSLFSKTIRDDISLEAPIISHPNALLEGTFPTLALQNRELLTKFLNRAKASPQLIP